MTGEGIEYRQSQLGEVVDELLAVLGTIERLAAGLGGMWGGWLQKYHNTMV